MPHGRRSRRCACGSADQHVPIRGADDHDQGPHDGPAGPAGRPPGRDRGPGRSAGCGADRPERAGRRPGPGGGAMSARARPPYRTAGAAGATALAAGLPDRRPGGRPRRRREFVKFLVLTSGAFAAGGAGSPWPGPAGPRAGSPDGCPRRPSWKIAGRSSSATRTSTSRAGPGAQARAVRGLRAEVLAPGLRRRPAGPRGAALPVSQRILRGRGRAASVAGPPRRPLPLVHLSGRRVGVRHRVRAADRSAGEPS